MGHGESWFNLLPFYENLQKLLQDNGQGVLGNQIALQHVCAALLVMLVLFLLGGRTRAQLNSEADNGLIPEPRFSVRNLLDMIFEALYNQMRATIGPDAGRYFPVIATLTLFIFFSNIMGLIPGFLPPTENWNTTFACGFFVFLYYNYHGLRVNGMHHIIHLANPIGETWGWFLAPLMFPIEVISHLARPFSLGVRLATNMIGDHAVLAAFFALIPVLVPVPFFFLGLMVCTIQTLVFVLLSIIYIALSVEAAHHDDDHAHAH